MMRFPLEVVYTGAAVRGVVLTAHTLSHDISSHTFTFSGTTSNSLFLQYARASK